MGWCIGTLSFQDWEPEATDRFMDLICLMLANRRGDDKMCKRPSKCRGFEVGGYNWLLCKPTLNSFPWKIIWIWKIPPRVAFFSWTAELGKILSIDKLWKRSIIVYWLVCYVQTKWGKHGPSTSTLSYSFRVVVFGFLCVWFTLGYAKVSKGSVSILAGQFWPAL